MTVPAGALAYDASFSLPDPAVMARAGFRAAGRYLAPPASGKSVSAAEVAELHAAGLAVWLYVEQGSQRAGAGHAAGVTDATTATRLAGELRVPHGVPLVYAVDYDAAPDAVLEYFAGLQSVASPYPVGGYGGYAVVEALAAHGVAWLVQTQAWSYGRVSTHAGILQRAAHTRPIAGVPASSYDECQVRNTRWPWWAAHTVPTPSEDDIVSSLITVHPGHTGKATLDVQGLLVSHGHPITCDGDYGPLSQAAVKAVQAAAGLAQTGVVDQATWRALLRLPAK